MNKSTNHPLSSTVRLLLMTMLAITLTLGTGQTARAFASPAPVNLGTAADFAILSETGISTTGVTAVTGDLGVSPAAETYITGFSLTMDGSGTYSTSSLVTGKIYAADDTAPTPAKMTAAIGDMMIAFADAAGRAPNLPTELYGGDLSNKTLAPGVYKWSTNVAINSGNLTLAGSASDVWIFEISQDLLVAAGSQVLLTGGAKANNVFWQVDGGTGVTFNAGSHVEGNVLASKAITMLSGASLNGRALSQTAVTMIANTIVVPSSLAPTVVSITCPKNPTNAATMNFTVTFSQAVTGVDAADFNLTTTDVNGAAIGVVTGLGTTWTVPVSTGTGDGTIRLNVNSSGTGITNVTNVPLSSGFIDGQICTIDKTKPGVSSIARANPDPTKLTRVNFTVTFSESVKGVNAADFTLKTTGVRGASVGSVTGSKKTWTVSVNTGSGNGAIRLNIKSSGTGITDAANNPLSGGFTSGQTYTVIKTATLKSLNFKSSGTQDGWVAESGQTSNVGRAMNSTAATIRLGDDAARKQYRSMLSFNTGANLPDTAVITSVILKVRKQSIAGGGDPVAMLQGFMVDIRKGAFATSALKASDFQATANKVYGPFNPGLVNSWYSLNLTSGKAYINKLAVNDSLTQIRLRFKLDDNNDGIANYLSLFSGNSTAANRPQLIIKYYVP